MVPATRCKVQRRVCLTGCEVNADLISLGPFWRIHLVLSSQYSLLLFFFQTELDVNVIYS